MKSMMYSLCLFVCVPGCALPRMGLIQQATQVFEGSYPFLQTQGDDEKLITEKTRFRSSLQYCLSQSVWWVSSESFHDWHYKSNILPGPPPAHQFNHSASSRSIHQLKHFWSCQITYKRHNKCCLSRASKLSIPTEQSLHLAVCNYIRW